ncbi:BPSS1187 family protein [Brevundimonas bacteroides]|uniref:BPSS1187 family protein n=1 Tax=Brevundimonas bacteroides TaxID=74311 RepID=UPI000496E65A|nr:hypothetical protein [Brevundimonas bacteroides]
MSVERELSPTTANPAVATNTAAHFVVTPNPAVAAQNRLFVMLPGSGAIPRFYREVVRTGASRGYHAIGLTYPNDTAVFDLCAPSPDPDCAGKARREILTGADLSPVVSVNRDDSIIGRLEDLIRHLDRTFPTEGWGRVLASGQLDWSRITMAGHSQGAGHAAYLGKLFSLDRTVMFSGPSDVGLTPTTLAPWLSLPNVTPAGRQFGFTHTGDELVPLALVSQNWTLLGLSEFGPNTSVDGAAAPYGLSRRLVTSVAPNPSPPGTVPQPRHSSPVVDAVTPLDAQGAPLYRPVWTYLAFP